MLSMIFIAIGYISLIAVFGWSGVGAVIVHLIIMCVPLGRGQKKGKS